MKKKLKTIEEHVGAPRGSFKKFIKAKEDVSKHSSRIRAPTGSIKDVHRELALIS